MLYVCSFFTRAHLAPKKKKFFKKPKKQSPDFDQSHSSVNIVEKYFKRHKPVGFEAKIHKNAKVQQCLILNTSKQN